MDALKEVEPDIDAFLRRFADDVRVERVQQWRDQIDLDRKARTFERPTRNQKDRPMSAAERALSEATQLAEVDPDLAYQRLQALIDVFSSDPQTQEDPKKILELAQRKLERLESTLAEQRTEYRNALEQRLDWADQQASDDPAAARRVREGIIFLYSSKPWASDLVMRAKKAIE